MLPGHCGGVLFSKELQVMAVNGWNRQVLTFVREITPRYSYNLDTWNLMHALILLGLL